MSNINIYKTATDNLPLSSDDWKTPEGGVGLMTLVGVPALLFLLLSPGFLITLPPAACPKDCTTTTSDKPTRLLMSYRTSQLAILVHTGVFAIALGIAFHQLLNKKGIVCLKSVGGENPSG
jgi:hypothetical protein